MKTSAPLCLLLLVLFLCSLFLSNSDALGRFVQRRFIRHGKKGKSQGRRSYNNNNNNRPSGRDPRFSREIRSKYKDTLLAVSFNPKAFCNSWSRDVF